MVQYSFWMDDRSLIIKRTHKRETEVFYSPPLRSWSHRASIPPADRSRTVRPLSQTQCNWRSTRWATDRQKETDRIRHVNSKHSFESMWCHYVSQSSLVLRCCYFTKWSDAPISPAGSENSWKKKLQFCKTIAISKQLHNYLKQTCLTNI